MQPWKISAGLTATHSPEPAFLTRRFPPRIPRAPLAPRSSPGHGVAVGLHAAFALDRRRRGHLRRRTGHRARRPRSAASISPNGPSGAAKGDPGPRRRAPAGTPKETGNDSEAPTRRTRSASVEGLPADWRRQAKVAPPLRGRDPGHRRSNAARRTSKPPSSNGTRPRSRSSRLPARADTPPTTSVASSATARSPTPDGPARPGSRSRTYPGRPTSPAEPRLAENPPPSRETSNAQIVQSIIDKGIE